MDMLGIIVRRIPACQNCISPQDRSLISGLITRSIGPRLDQSIDSTAAQVHMRLCIHMPSDQFGLQKRPSKLQLILNVKDVLAVSTKFCSTVTLAVGTFSCS